MSENLYQLFTTQFSTNLELKLQQQGSKLRGKVAEGSHVGKQASPVQQIGAIAMRSPAGRFAPKNRTDADFARRWVFPIDKELDQLLDSFDQLKTIVEPKSQYMTGAANAAGRAWDDQIIGAAFATAKTGVDAGSLSDETWDTTFNVADTFGAGATSVGLTVAKMIEARRILRHYHATDDFDSEQVTAVIGSTQEADLLKQVQVVSTEFNDKPVLVDGKVVRFLGFNIVVSERLTVGSNIRDTIFFVQSGLYLGIWKDMTNRVSIRNDISGEPYDLYTAMSSGATRTQLGKVIKVRCADTVGSDITA